MRLSIAVWISVASPSRSSYSRWYNQLHQSSFRYHLHLVTLHSLVPITSSPSILPWFPGTAHPFYQTPILSCFILLVISPSSKQTPDIGPSGCLHTLFSLLGTPFLLSGKEAEPKLHSFQSISPDYLALIDFPSLELSHLPIDTEGHNLILFICFFSHSVITGNLIVA